MQITVFNRYVNPETRKEAWLRTVLSGERTIGGPAVHWESNKATNTIKSGLKDADAVNVMIWFSVDAEGKVYAEPLAYGELSAEDATLHWTMTPGKDYLFKGVAPVRPFKEIVGKLDGLIQITSVDSFDYGSNSMRHWEVAGK